MQISDIGFVNGTDRLFILTEEPLMDGGFFDVFDFETDVYQNSFFLPAGTLARMAEQQGAVGMISGPLFRDYLVPFEITSVLLLAAVIGSIVLAKRRL